MLDIKFFIVIVAIACAIASLRFFNQANQERYDPLSTPEHKTVAGVIAIIMTITLVILFLLN